MRCCFIFLYALMLGQAEGQYNSQIRRAQKNKKAVQEQEYKMAEENKSLGIDLAVEKYQLSNGLQVLLHSDTRIPLVYHLLLVKVGSRDEVEGKTGLAHLFEHMMFRGTAKYTGEEYEERLESIGAKNNAYTSRDYTGYEVTLPRSYLEMILEMEAERLSSLQLTQNHFDKEREVVKEERRQRTDNNPNEFFEPLMKMVFKKHSYGRPIIGWMKDIEAMSLQDCKDFYQQYYAPNNSILVLAGDFNVKKTKKWIEKYYGALKPSQINRPATLLSEKQKEKRSVQFNRAIQAPTIAFAYRGPGAEDSAVYSLEVLSRILTSGESSRLHQSLVYKQKLALSTGGFYYSLKESGVFIIFVKMAPGADPEKVKKTIYAEMQKTYNESVDQKELLKSKRSIMHEYVVSVKELSGKANSLGLNEAYFGDYRRFFKDLEKLQKVSAETIKTQSRKYLLPEYSSVVELFPLREK